MSTEVSLEKVAEVRRLIDLYASEPASESSIVMMSRSMVLADLYSLLSELYRELQHEYGLKPTAISVTRVGDPERFFSTAKEFDQHMTEVMRGKE